MGGEILFFGGREMGAGGDDARGRRAVWRSAGTIARVVEAGITLRCAGLSAVSVCESIEVNGGEVSVARAWKGGRGPVRRRVEWMPKGRMVPPETARLGRNRRGRDENTIGSHIVARIRTHRAGAFARDAPRWPVRGARSHALPTLGCRSKKCSRRAPNSRPRSSREPPNVRTAIHPPLPMHVPHYPSFTEPESDVTATHATRHDALSDLSARVEKKKSGKDRRRDAAYIRKIDGLIRFS